MSIGSYQDLHEYFINGSEEHFKENEDTIIKLFEDKEGFICIRELIFWTFICNEQTLMENPPM